MSTPPWRQKSNQLAYTAVNTKRTLARPQAPSKNSSAPSSQGSSSTASTSSTVNNTNNNSSDPEWPDSLKRFVGRSFDEMLPGDSEILDSQLRQIITTAHEMGTKFTLDWDKITLPIIAKRRKEAAEKKKEEKAAAKKLLKAAKKDTHDLSSRIKDKKRNNLFDLNESDSMRAKRLRRFDNDVQHHSVSPPPSDNVDINEPFVGRSTVLEKRYLRLTSAPDPNTVRPLHILKQTLELLKTKWKAEQNYSYICDQFKSLRQDLTVQHVQNEFTVSVYEIHARIALEKGDLGEYNQCQSQLKTLYKMNIPGHEDEFLAYRILYILHTRNRADMNDIYFQLEQFRDPDTSELPHAVQHALDVNSALQARNYHRLFELYLRAPNVGPYVMDMFMRRERVAALAAMTKAFRPELDADYIVKELGFLDSQELKEFAKEAGIDNCIEAKEVENESSTSDEETDGTQLEEDETSGKDKSRRKEGRLFLKSKEAYPILEQLRTSAFKKIDIKGQI